MLWRRLQPHPICVPKAATAKSPTKSGDDANCSLSWQLIGAPCGAPKAAAEALARPGSDGVSSFSLQPTDALDSSEPSTLQESRTLSTSCGEQLASANGSDDAHRAYQAKIDRRLRELTALPRSAHRDAHALSMLPEDAATKLSTMPKWQDAASLRHVLVQPSLTVSGSGFMLSTLQGGQYARGDAGGIDLPRLSAAEGKGIEPNTLNAPIKTPLVAMDQPHSESGDGSGDGFSSPHLDAADGSSIVSGLLNTPVKTLLTAIDQPHGESSEGSGDGFGSPHLDTDDGRGIMSGLLDTPVKTQLVAVDQPHGKSGDGSGGGISSPRLDVAGSGGIVLSPLVAPVKTPPVTIGLTIGHARGALNSVAVPPKILSAMAPGSMLSMGNGTLAVTSVCKSAFLAAAVTQGRARGRRAGRHNPHPDRVVEPCASRSRRTVVHG